MARVFVTGSSTGLGLMAAQLLLELGHRVVVHGRNQARTDVALAAAPRADAAVIGDLSKIRDMRAVAEQVNRLGEFELGDPQCWYWLPRIAACRDRGSSSRAIRNQYTGAVRADGADRAAEAACLPEFRHASERQVGYQRPYLGKAPLAWSRGLCGDQVARRADRVRRSTAMAGRALQCTRARLGGDQDGRCERPGHSG